MGRTAIDLLMRVRHFDCMQAHDLLSALVSSDRSRAIFSQVLKLLLKSLRPEKVAERFGDAFFWSSSFRLASRSTGQV